MVFGAQASSLGDKFVTLEARRNVVPIGEFNRGGLNEESAAEFHERARLLAEGRFADAELDRDNFQDWLVDLREYLGGVFDPRDGVDELDVRAWVLEMTDWLPHAERVFRGVEGLATGVRCDTRSR